MHDTEPDRHETATDRDGDRDHDGRRAHPVSPGDLGTRRLVLAIAINVLLSAGQVIGGILSGSLSLIADALHNFSDAAGLLLALLARRIARRPADRDRTFGYGRAEVVAGLVNLTAIMVIAGFLVIEAITRALDPPAVDGWPIIVIAGLALAVDAATAGLTHSVSHGGINLRAAFLHNLADAAASAAVIVSGVLILTLGWRWVDLAATVLIAAWIALASWPPLRRSILILMQSTPEDLSLTEVARTIAEVDGVVHVSHLHVWPIDESSVSLEAHVQVDPGSTIAESDALRGHIRDAVGRRHGIGHVTLELVGHAETPPSLVVPHP